MLYDNGQNGKLFGKIILEESIKNSKDLSLNLTENSDDDLKFDEKTQKLSFKSDQTNQCQYGCIIEIIYFYESLEIFYPLSSYEYTLLIRVWDEEDYDSNTLIKIEFNEYIFGCFEEDDSINIHYYYIDIPDKTKKIIIQIEGSNIEGFIGKGSKKLNPYKKNIKKLDITKNKPFKIYEIDNLNDFNDNDDKISFTFRSKDFYLKSFSYYYFRIIQIIDNENLILPLNLNLRSICLKQGEEKEENLYYCYFLLKNEHKEYFAFYNNDNENYNYNTYYNATKTANDMITCSSAENFDIKSINFIHGHINFQSILIIIYVIFFINLNLVKTKQKEC